MKELQEILKYTKDLVEQEPEKSAYWHYNKLVSKIEEAISVTRCCESDSELLLGFLDKLERIDALKHTENWQKKTYVASYLKAK